MPKALHEEKKQKEKKYLFLNFNSRTLDFEASTLPETTEDDNKYIR